MHGGAQNLKIQRIYWNHRGAEQSWGRYCRFSFCFWKKGWQMRGMVMEEVWKSAKIRYHWRRQPRSYDARNFLSKTNRRWSWAFENPHIMRDSWAKKYMKESCLKIIYREGHRRRGWSVHVPHLWFLEVVLLQVHVQYVNNNGQQRETFLACPMFVTRPFLPDSAQTDFCAQLFQRTELFLSNSVTNLKTWHLICDSITLRG